MTTTSSPPTADPSAAAEFAEALFGHESLRGHKIGTSRFPPNKGVHVWHDTPDAAATWSIAQAGAGNAYMRTTPVAKPPSKGRGKANIASAIVGVHCDTDIAHGVHKKENLPPDVESARRLIESVGILPTMIVNSGHGLQGHWLFKEPWMFVDNDERDRAADIAARFQATIAASAKTAGGWDHDGVGDLARILRVPGTINVKAEPVPVTILVRDGPRYLLEDIESILISDEEAAAAACDDAGPAGDAPKPGGFPGSDDELIAAASRAANGERFREMFENGDASHYGGDHSRADWHLIDCLAFWCGPDAARLDRLFRRSRLMRPKWDEVHGGDGQTYGRMTIDDVLSKRRVFFKVPRPLPVVVVTNRQLRDQTSSAVAALEEMNRVPCVFQRGEDIVRVRVDEATNRHVIQRLGINEMVGLLTRSANYVRISAKGKALGTVPPQSIAKDILAMPHWRFPALAGVVTHPRIRPDGSILLKPGYDPTTKLYMVAYEGWKDLSVPDTPTEADVRDAVALIEELICDFPFVDQASKANAIAFMLTPFLRPAILGATPVAAFDALSKQGTGKGLLVRVTMIVANGSEPAMSAMPDDEHEWRKSLTALLSEGRDVIVFDNATNSFIESGVFANAITADVFDDRILGETKRASLPVKCTWAITGNGMTFGGDMVRRTYQVVQDARCERPEDRTKFRHELPRWAQENRLPLVRACLILCRNWWAQGCPKPIVPVWGSFEVWTRIVGGVLEWSSIDGFLANRVTFRDAADTDRAEWTGFAAALAEQFPMGREFTTADVVTAIELGSPLTTALPPYLEEAKERGKGFAIRLGRALHKHAGGVFGLHRLVELERDGHSKRPRFRIEVTQSAGDAG
jgi:hypothetical protein